MGHLFNNRHTHALRRKMIYYVEDDTNIRDLVIYTLNQTGFEAHGFISGKEFWNQMKMEKPELIILDIMLPNESGIDILKRLRASHDTNQIPVIMLTAKNSEYDAIMGLDSGADDYITKPFGVMELVSRIKAVLRRVSPQKNKSELKAGDVTLNSDRHTVYVSDEAVNLTNKEFELLKLLMENKGIVFSREHILNSIWNYDYDGGTRTVDVHIQTLRQKLGEGADIIHTVRGVGYSAKEFSK